MARATGTVLGLDSFEMGRLEAAAYLHDIGLIGRPDNNGSGATVPCRDAARPDDVSYCLRGVKIVSEIPWLAEILPVILFHRERWDGWGSPSGLVRDTIPLEARVVSVIDSFDRMVHGLLGSCRLPVSEALDRIRKESDKMYDPRVVSAFMEACAASLTINDLWGTSQLAVGVGV